MDTVEITSTIKTLSGKYGFVDAGIIIPHRPEHYDVFLSWLSNGQAGSMDYLGATHSLECRANPLLVFPECKSIIVLLARYSSPDVDGVGLPKDLTGKVAAYACGEDYHLILVEKLNQMAAELAEITGRGVKSRSMTDSAPLLERELAYAAGLGWIGKNSCLISPIHGSYTFIAELMTNIDLEPNVMKIQDHCGTCRRCVDACPTQCILPNHTLAAKRCLAYLTIEHRGHIPLELRPAMDEWIFGCDVCQSVCPWNRKVDDSYIDPRFFVSNHIKTLDLCKELSLTADEFKIIYEQSPINRAKMSGYLRNIALVLGNQRYLPARGNLIDLLKSTPDAPVRASAVWALGHMNNESTKLELEDMLKSETDEIVRNEIARVLLL
jgi:epoxyqueuosine reductase